MYTTNILSYQHTCFSVTFLSQILDAKATFLSWEEEVLLACVSVPSPANILLDQSRSIASLRSIKKPCHTQTNVRSTPSLLYIPRAPLSICWHARCRNQIVRKWNILQNIHSSLLEIWPEKKKETCKLQPTRKAKLKFKKNLQNEKYH